MLKFTVFLFMAAVLVSPTLMAQKHVLKVSPNKRYLVKADGSPFFYLGDTAWELFHRLNREEADRYLKNRADKGYTVIQAVVLAELNGLRDPNPYGHLPLIDEDPAKPNEEYFKHVDYIVNKAEELGLYIAMLPTWGDKVFKESWGDGPEVFTPQNAEIFGEYVGRRYRDKPIIWVIGGDRNPREQDLPIWRAMARGVTKGVGNPENAMMTFHPQPTKQGSSSNWFHNDDWLDFNMHQTGHCRDTPIYDRITEDYTLTPVKPTLNGEPLYEDHPVCFNAAENGYSYPSDIRRGAYLSLFAGAHGHTYGCHNVWQMWQPGRKPVNGPLKPWYESLDLPGATQMTYVRALMESRPMMDRIPDQSLISDPGDITNRIQATRGKDYIFVYSASGKPFTVTMGKISGKQLKGYWFNPRNGETTSIGQFDNTGRKEFTPPAAGPDNDWILILDDGSKNYKAPQMRRTNRQL
jgi:hypothetical protein